MGSDAGCLSRSRPCLGWLCSSPPILISRRGSPVATNYLSGGEVVDSSARLRTTWTTYAFAQMVREATPETTGFLDETRTPEYGVLVPPTRDTFSRTSRDDPSPANNLGPYLDPRSLPARSVLLQMRGDPTRGPRLSSNALKVRYFVTVAREAPCGYVRGGGTSLQRRFAVGPQSPQHRPHPARRRRPARMGDPSGPSADAARSWRCRPTSSSRSSRARCS